jgi:hypothetical protein
MNNINRKVINYSLSKGIMTSIILQNLESKIHFHGKRQ